MQEGLGKPYSRKSKRPALAIELTAIMPTQRNIDGQLLVTRSRCPADIGIPLRAPMRRGNEQRSTDLIAQALQMIEKLGVMPIGLIAKSTTAATRQLGHRKVRPPPICSQVIARLNRRCKAHKKSSLLTLEARIDLIELS